MPEREQQRDEHALLARLHDARREGGHRVAPEAEDHRQHGLAVEAHAPEHAVRHDGEARQVARVLEHREDEEERGHDRQDDGDGVGHAHREEAVGAPRRTPSGAGRRSTRRSRTPTGSAIRSRRAPARRAAVRSPPTTTAPVFGRRSQRGGVDVDARGAGRRRTTPSSRFVCATTRTREGPSCERRRGARCRPPRSRSGRAPTEAQGPRGWSAPGPRRRCASRRSRRRFPPRRRRRPCRRAAGRRRGWGGPRPGAVATRPIACERAASRRSPARVATSRAIRPPAAPRWTGREECDRSARPSTRDAAQYTVHPAANEAKSFHAPDRARAWRCTRTAPRAVPRAKSPSAGRLQPPKRRAREQPRRRRRRTRTSRADRPERAPPVRAIAPS